MGNSFPPLLFAPDVLKLKDRGKEVNRFPSDPRASMVSRVSCRTRAIGADYLRSARLFQRNGRQTPSGANRETSGTSVPVDHRRLAHRPLCLWYLLTRHDKQGGAIIHWTSNSNRRPDPIVTTATIMRVHVHVPLLTARARKLKRESVQACKHPLSIGPSPVQLHGRCEPMDAILR